MSTSAANASNHERSFLPTDETASFSDSERLQIAQQVGIATTTLYPTWRSGEGGPITSDKVRGDLALTTAGLAAAQGYKFVVVDGGSSEEFKKALEATGVVVEAQSEPGMSAGRRQAFESVSKLDGVKVICWTEPEKVSMVRDCLIEPAKLILEDKADLIIPSRDGDGFGTYPDYQVKFEKESNKAWNGILRRHHLLDDHAEQLDAWIGPRIFKNEPGLVSLFEDRYEFVGERQSGLTKDHPDLWSNAIFLPIIAALARKYRVQSVPVAYKHPAQQTAIEQDSPEFQAKRALQQKSILIATVHFIRLLEGNTSSRLRR